VLILLQPTARQLIRRRSQACIIFLTDPRDKTLVVQLFSTLIAFYVILRFMCMFTRTLG